VVAGDQEATIGPGAIVLVPAGQTRGVTATTRLVAVHLVSPPPTEEDHAQVQAGLQRETWR
jgi:mannose-6-phosphate isomerase-like protein (cupin superfamily)